MFMNDFSEIDNCLKELINQFLTLKNVKRNVNIFKCLLFKNFKTFRKLRSYCSGGVV